MALVVYQSLPMLDNGSRQVVGDAFKPMVRTSVEPHVAVFSGTIAFQSIKCMFSYIILEQKYEMFYVVCHRS
jgi:hypothetical protein